MGVTATPSERSYAYPVAVMTISFAGRPERLGSTSRRSFSRDAAAESTDVGVPSLISAAIHAPLRLCTMASASRWLLSR